MNILITGGTGFLGSRLASSLRQYYNVKVTSRGIKNDYLTREDLKSFNFVPIDLRDRNSLKKNLTREVDLVIHCAAVIQGLAEARCRTDLVDTNLLGTINLVETMCDRGIKNFIFCSSMSVYGLKNKVPVKENGVLDPIHFYGLTKKWGEEAVMKYSKAGLIKSLILRFPGLYGFPRRNGYIYNAARKLIRNEVVEIDSRGLKFWETINVDDAASMILKLLKAWKWKPVCQILNCSYGKEVDFIDTAFKIREIVRSKSKIKIKKPIDYDRFYLDNSKLKKLIKFDYEFDSKLESFLKTRADWLKQ